VLSVRAADPRAVVVRHGRAVVMSDGGGPAAPGEGRWAAEQVVRQHEGGRCKQCVAGGCPMLAWAQGVLGGGVVAYPRVDPVRPLLTG